MDQKMALTFLTMVGGRQKEELKPAILDQGYKLIIIHPKKRSLYTYCIYFKYKTVTCEGIRVDLMKKIV